MMAIDMKDSGEMIWQMDKENISTTMEQFILENGLMINKMAKVLNNGQMVLNTMVNIF